MGRLSHPFGSPEDFPEELSETPAELAARKGRDLARVLREHERDKKARGYDALFPDGWPEWWLYPEWNEWAHGRADYCHLPDDYDLELMCTGYPTEADFKRTMQNREAQRRRAAKVKAEKAAAEAAMTREERAEAHYQRMLKAACGRLRGARAGGSAWKIGDAALYLAGLIGGDSERQAQADVYLATPSRKRKRAA